jgi:AcrR family transcriptional regulator
MQRPGGFLTAATIANCQDSPVPRNCNHRGIGGGIIVNARTRQREATQASILKAALEEFSGKGFDGASTREIAAKAGVHHALIKYHFKSKDLLWRAAVKFLFDREAAELDLPSQSDPAFADPKAYAREMIRRRARYWARFPEHARLMVQESCRDSDRLRWMNEEYTRRSAEIGAAFVRFLQANGMAPSDAPVASLVYIIMGASQLYFTLAPEARRVWGVDPTDPKTIETHVDVLARMLIP